jgi:SAM-dependent methyltransferase
MSAGSWNISMDIPQIYQAMRRTEMNDWVGGSDPELVGEVCASILLRHLPVDGHSWLLDFGMGIGRVAAAVLRQRPQLRRLTGFDIVPRMVEFCEQNFVQFANVNFELIEDRNSHYEHHKVDARPKSRAEVLNAYRGQIDSAYAFSVFTHIDVGDFVDLLRFVRELLQPGGRFLFTVFALTAFSRDQIEKAKTVVPLVNPTYEENGAVLIGNTADRLAFIAYDIARLEQMVWAAGLIPSVFEFGDWRGDKLSATFQDVIVCRKPLE